MSTNSSDQYTESPVTESILGVSGDVVIRGVTELYIPKKFKNISCEVIKFSHTFLNLKHIVLRIEFTLNGDIGKFGDLYLDEGWKFQTLENFFKTSNYSGPRLSFPAPVIGLMLNKYLRVQSVTDLNDGHEVCFDQAIDNVFSFDSFKPKPELQNEETYSYYNKKTTFVYDNLKIGHRYSYEIVLASEGVHFEFGLLLPFGKVNIHTMEGKTSSDIITQTYVHEISPMISKKLPELLTQKLERHLPGNRDYSYPTHIKPASSHRGEDVLFPPNGAYGTPVFGSPEEIPDDWGHDINSPQIHTLDNFKSLRLVTSMMIPEDKDFEIIPEIQKNPIPSRIYEDLERMSSYEDVFVNFDIFNLTNKKRRLRIEIDIPDYATLSKKIFIVHGLGNGRDGRKARVKINLCPRLKRDVLNSIINTEKATLIATVTDEDTKEVLYDDTHQIILLPSDQMVWSIKNPRNSHSYNLSKFIASWIKPKDSLGLLDSIRVGSAKYHLGGSPMYDGTPESLLEHVKAVYQFLANDLKLIYVNQPFNGCHQYDAQRVLLPENVLKNGAGNCIDLTVLFASVLEGFGIQSLVFITRDHAYIGWGNPKSIKTMIALETTGLGKLTFEQALTVGAKNLSENFLLKFQNEIMFPDMTYLMLGSQIISLEECRRSGIYCKI